MFVNAREDKRLPDAGEKSKLPMERSARTDPATRPNRMPVSPNNNILLELLAHQLRRKTLLSKYFIRQPSGGNSNHPRETIFNREPTLSTSKPHMTQQEIVAEAKRLAVPPLLSVHKQGLSLKLQSYNEYSSNSVSMSKALVQNQRYNSPYTRINMMGEDS